MKTEDRFANSYVGVGFTVIVVAALVCGAAALKVLFTDFNRPLAVKLPTVPQVTVNQQRCDFLCW